MVSLMRFSNRATWVIVLVGLVYFSSFSLGQQAPDQQFIEEPALPEGEGLETDAAENESVLDMIGGSGATGIAFMVVLGLFSIIAGTVAFERAVNMRRRKVIGPELVQAIEESVANQLVAPGQLAEICQQHGNAMSTIVSSGLLRLGYELADIEKSFEDAAAREMAEFRARIRPLSTVGSIAPLVGLLGTVVGMIVAFHTASHAGLGKAELLAKGIYMALLTTAGGLSIAIPSLLLATYFNTRAEKFFRDIDVLLMKLLPLLAATKPDLSALPKQLTAGSILQQANPVEALVPEPTVGQRSPPSDLTPALAAPVLSEFTTEEEKEDTVAVENPVDQPRKPAASAKPGGNPLMSMEL